VPHPRTGSHLFLAAIYLFLLGTFLTKNRGTHDEFKKVEGYDVVPDGEYWTVVEDVAMELGKTFSHPHLYWSLRILGPDHYGRILKRVFVIKPVSVKWLKRDLFLCGLQLESLSDLPDRLEDLSNLKLKVKKESRSVRIITCDGGAHDTGHLFLHFVDDKGRDYLDQQLRPRQQPEDQEGFRSLIGFFVRRYGCPRPHEAYIEDGKNGAIIFSTEPV
jgi:hypothetical protein